MRLRVALLVPFRFASHPDYVNQSHLAMLKSSLLLPNIAFLTRLCTMVQKSSTNSSLTQQRSELLAA